MKLWIVVAGAARARVFSAAGAGGPVAVVKELEFPAGRAKGKDVTTDRPGRVRVGLGSRSTAAGVTAMDRHTPLREAEADQFARRIAAVLTEGHAGNAYDGIVLVAPPHFLGRLRPALGHVLEKLVAAELTKDYSELEPAEVTKLIKPIFATAGKGEAVG